MISILDPGMYQESNWEKEQSLAAPAARKKAQKPFLYRLSNIPFPIVQHSYKLIWA